MTTASATTGNEPNTFSPPTPEERGRPTGPLTTKPDQTNKPDQTATEASPPTDLDPVDRNHPPSGRPSLPSAHDSK